MNKDDIDTILVAKRNYKIFLGSTIITSILIFSGIGLLATIEWRSNHMLIYMLFVLTTCLSHILGSAGFGIWRPLGKKRAPVSYSKLLFILERQLHKDAASIEYIGTVSRNNRKS